MKLPVDFEAKVRQPAQASGGGYPVQLSAGDLMKNFTYSAADFDEESFIVTESGNTRKVALKTPIPTPPTSGTFVLGSVGGVLTWIATEEC